MPDSSPLRPSCVLAAFVEQVAEGRRVLVFGDATSGLWERLVDRGARLIHVCDPDPARVASAAARNTSQAVSFAPLSSNGLAVREGAFDIGIVENLAATVELDSQLLLSQLGRALSARGMAVVATPNPKATRPLLGSPAAPRSIDYYELFELVSKQFGSAAMFGQMPFIGYAVARFGVAGDPEPAIDSGYVPGGAEEPEWFIALSGVASATLDPYQIIQLHSEEALAQRQPSLQRQLQFAQTAEREALAKAGELQAECERLRSRERQLDSGERLERELVELKQQVRQRDAWIAQLEARADTADSRADEVQGELEQSQAALERSRDELERSRVALARSREELEASRGAPARREQELSRFEGQLASIREQLASSQDKHASSREQLARAQQELTEQRREAANAQQELIEQRREAANAQRSLLELQAARAETNESAAQLAAKDATLVELRASLQGSEAQRSRLRAELEQARQRAEHAAAQLKVLEARSGSLDLEEAEEAWAHDVASLEEQLRASAQGYRELEARLLESDRFARELLDELESGPQGEAPSLAGWGEAQLDPAVAPAATFEHAGIGAQAWSEVSQAAAAGPTSATSSAPGDQAEEAMELSAGLLLAQLQADLQMARWAIAKLQGDLESAKLAAADRGRLEAELERARNELQQQAARLAASRSPSESA